MKEHGLIKEKPKKVHKKKRNKSFNMNKLLSNHKKGKYKSLKAFDSAYRKLLK